MTCVTSSPATHMLVAGTLARLLLLLPVAFAASGPAISASAQTQGPSRLLAWNDLGMHCIHGDMWVLSILPPFNAFYARLIVSGQLVANPTTRSPTKR